MNGKMLPALLLVSANAIFRRRCLFLDGVPAAVTSPFTAS